MATYSAEQVEAIRQAQEILQRAGLQPADILGDDHQLPNNTPQFLINYTPRKATLFTSEEISNQKNRVTRESYIDGIVDHPMGAILEFPETGERPDMAIGHIFHVNSRNFVNPKGNIQYSLGEPKSMHYDILCYLLLDQVTGEPLKCRQTKLTCQSIKTCSFNPTGGQPHSTTMPLDARGELFMKTLAFFCALREVGCAFMKNTSELNDLDETDDENEDISTTENSSLDLVAVLKDKRSGDESKSPTCNGKLLLQKDKFDHYYIRCELRAKGRSNHLLLLNVNEYDIEYLTALFENDSRKIKLYEVAAEKDGYGPLYPCSTTAAPREQKQLCPMWHRDNGILQRGQMEFKQTHKCDCRFEIYEPNELSRCPYILLVCRNPHSHPSPPRNKTPESIKLIFDSLLQHLEWRLADATPRRILLDNTFIHNLRKILTWTEFRDPGLGDLHPSLMNHDHAARLINDMRYQQYPKGTGLAGAKHLLKRHLELSPEEQYLRCVETHENPTDGKFHTVICMFRAMSHLLMKAKRPSIDTAFKRLDKWQEFEMEAWFPEYARSLVVARAFTTSQSAEAHQILFRLLFTIVQEDTGHCIQFRHIHGNGIDTITADGHEGQALGLGLYLQEICQPLTQEWSVEWAKPLKMLTPREHLMCLYRYCFVHFTRNVAKLRGDVKPNVIAAMMSLASSDALPDYEEVVKTIRNGGPKASKWLKNKEKGDGVTLAAIYRPLSKIPLEIWKAAPSTSNGNEQAHRNINRDGTKLTMLAGIMRGLQFDSRAMANIESWEQEHITPRDRLSTHFRRAERGVRVKASIQQRNVLAKDLEILTLHEKARDLQTKIITDVTAVKGALEAAEEDVVRAPKRRRKNGEQNQYSKTLEDLERAQKQLRNHDEQLTETQTQLDALLPRGSGSYALTKLQKPEELYDHQLLDAKPKKKQKQAQKVQTEEASRPRQDLILQTGHEYAYATPPHTYYDHSQYHDTSSQSGYYRGSQPQHGYYGDLQSQPGYNIGIQHPSPFYNNSQVHNGFFDNSQPQIAHAQVASFGQQSTIAGHAGPPHAHPANGPPTYFHYHHPGYFSQPHFNFH